MSQDGFSKTGFIVLSNFIDPSRIQHILSSIENFRKTRKVIHVQRTHKERSLDYKVIHGLEIANHLSELVSLQSEIQKQAGEITGLQLEPIASEMVAINVNITSQHGEYRWHYDRNDISAILYLNAVEGGELDVYPNYRLFLKRQKKDWLQKKLDFLMQLKLCRKVFGKRLTLKPEPGMLLIFKGQTTLHSVCPVTSNIDRISIIFAYDQAGRQHVKMDSLDRYLYSNDSVDKQKDPNYY